MEIFHLQLETRRNKHLNNINFSEKYHNVVSKHKLEYNHDFNCDNLPILHKKIIILKDF